MLNFLYFSHLLKKIFTFRHLDDLISFLNSLFGVIDCGAEITWLGAKMRAPLMIQWHTWRRVRTQQRRTWRLQPANGRHDRQAAENVAWTDGTLVICMTAWQQQVAGHGFCPCLFQFFRASDHQKLLRTVKRSAFQSVFIKFV
jgi:hypothetical protein